MRSVVLLFLVLFLVPMLSGCFDDADDDGSDPVDPRAAAFDLPHDYLGCQGVEMVVLVDQARLQNELPENVTVRDAGEFLGLPVAAGSGALVVATFRCTRSEAIDEPAQWASVAAVIEPLQIPNETFDEGSDRYALEHYASPAAERMSLQRIALQSTNASIVQTPLVPGRFEAADTAVMGDDGAARYRFTVVTPREQVGAGPLRLWSRGADGVGWFGADWTTQDHVGTVPACTLGPSTIAARILRETDCTNAAVLGIYHALDMEGALHWRPSASG